MSRLAFTFILMKTKSLIYFKTMLIDTNRSLTTLYLQGTMDDAVNDLIKDINKLRADLTDTRHAPRMIKKKDIFFNNIYIMTVYSCNS